MAEIPAECAEILNLMHIFEVAHHKASDVGGRAHFNARKQYVMSQDVFSHMADMFALMLDGIVKQRPEDIYTREKVSEFEYTFRFDYVRLKLTYDPILGGAFCVVEDAWNEVDAAEQQTNDVVKKMLGRH